MQSLTWNLPEVATITNIAKPAFDTVRYGASTALTSMTGATILQIEDFNTIMGVGVVWAITRYILSHTNLPEGVLRTFDMCLCSILLWKMIEIVVEVYSQLMPVFAMKLGGVS